MAIRDMGFSGKVGGLAAAAILGGAICANAQAPAGTKLKNILLLDKSQGGANGHLESRRDLNAALASLATKYGFTVTTIGQNDPASKITTEFSTTGLAKYQVVLFSNNDGVDAQLDAASKTNFENYVKGGGGFMPIHAASAFISNWPWITSVLVQSFYGPHGNNMPKANLTHDAEGIKDGTETKGIFKGLTAPLAFLDEYYSFQRSPRGVTGVTVLTTVDEKSYSQPVNGPMGADHPVNWVKSEGKGRVVHMSMGHSWSSNNVYTASSNYLTNFVYGALRFAAGDFVGCTDNKYKEYNADATKSDQTACLTLNSTSISENQVGERLSLISQGSTTINVSFSVAGAHEVTISDVTGKVVDRKVGTGAAQYALPTPNKAGMYVVKAKVNGHTQVQRITVL
jgi:type 1 glutamine amidotransferase